jgi:Mg2+/Co2+ transporter CorC
MYWAIESQNVGNFITGDLPDEFDDDDKSDLAGMADGSIEADSQLWP